MDRPHSNLGVISSFFAIVAGLGAVALVIAAGVMGLDDPDWLGEDSARAMLFALLLLTALVVDIVALALGVSGLFQRRRRKTFAVLGIALSVGTGAFLGYVVVLVSLIQ